ncbi:MAG: class I SAM-dependent methyltransferase [Bacteroidales bacterium]|jgi:SAM-dependent methyltransferase|nr:class I SAM-dependent methyltransferase [Bacteroidales bacterium]
MKCRHCGQELHHVFIDLFNSPPSNSYLNYEQLNEPETLYPLKIFVCDKCFLVQIDEYKKSDEIFDANYAYFSSYSTSWLEHSKRYVDMIVPRLGLNEQSYVIEIASNDGYLLQYVKEQNIPCLGIEPTASTAKVSREKGIDTLEEFFGAEMAKSLQKADLILGNNVLAHVPDINDFVKGLKNALKPQGTITIEFPHLYNLLKYNQFDTIYHEHFSYLSLVAVQTIFAVQGLKIYDVEEIPTHGGSLRIFATHTDNTIAITENVKNILAKEKEAKMNTLDGYLGFEQKVQQIKWNFLDFLLQARKENKSIAAYGAAAKGNTFLNYCGVKSDAIKFVVDANPHKQNKFTPMSHIPIVSEEKIKEEKPDYVVIFPWNLAGEIAPHLRYIKSWGGDLLLAIPNLKIIKDFPPKRPDIY